MSNQHRILWFDSKVRSRNYPNSKSISEEFEISNRQAQRDIEYLKSLGAPLFYDFKKRGYDYEHDNFILPNTFLSINDRELLQFLAYKYRQYDHTMQNQEIAKSLSKLVEIDEIKREFLFFNLDARQYSLYSNLIKGIQNCLKVKIHFINGEVFIFHPYKLMHKYENDYLLGYNESLKKTDEIRIDNIFKTTALDSCFEVIDVIELEGNASKIKPFMAKIRVGDSFRLSNSYSLFIKSYEESILSIEFYKEEEIITYLIQNDSWEKILSPKWLIKSFKERIHNISSKL